AARRGLRVGAGRLQEDARRRARALDRRVVRPAAAEILQGPGAPPLMRALALLVALAQPAVPAGAPSAPEPKAASPVRVPATRSKSEVSVGEAFTLELDATGPAGTTYTFAAEASADALELRTPPPHPGSSGAATATEPGTHRYEATVYALGEVQLPAL